MAKGKNQGVIVVALVGVAALAAAFVFAKKPEEQCEEGFTFDKDLQVCVPVAPPPPPPPPPPDRIVSAGISAITIT